MSRPIASLLLFALSACGSPPVEPECSVDGDCAGALVCRDGMCETAGASDAGSSGDDAGPPREDAGPFDAGACAACGAGEACVEDACVADCRLPDARSCSVPLVCSTESGSCVEPGEECTPDGDFVPCGTSEFPPVCGPGTTCDVRTCIAAAPCAEVTCDSGGVCRGVDCGATGGTVTGLTLDAVADVPRGVAGGLPVGATVAGEDLCGETVTFEVRVETALFTTAGNDGAVFEVDLETGDREVYIAGLPLVFGLETDAVGTLYALRSDTCEVGRIVGPAGARTFETVGMAPSGTGARSCSRIAMGPDGAIYAAGNLSVNRIDLFTEVTTPHASIPDGSARWGQTFLTGLTFSPDGTLIVGEHWDGLFSVGPAGGVVSPYATAPDTGMVMGNNPWNEGMVFGPDGLLYVGVFPSLNTGGIVYRINADLSGEVIEDLASIQADVPATNYTGIHGVAFGLDGALYFTNQNTASNTMEAFGQLLVRRVDGTVEVIADGFNFDWPAGYDGDLIVGTRVVASETATVGLDGRATADLDAPDVDGAYEVRVYVTDPATGQVFTERDAARTQ